MSDEQPQTVEAICDGKSVSVTIQPQDNARDIAERVAAALAAPVARPTAHHMAKIIRFPAR